MTLKLPSEASGPSLSDLLDRLELTDDESDGWLATCPAHPDSHASLRVTVADGSGKVLLHDRAGCTAAAVMESLGWTLRDLARMPVDVDHAPTTSSTSALPAPPLLASLATRLDGYAAALHTSAGTDALAYAAQRFGVEPEDARRLGLGVARDLGGGARLVVPFRDADGHPLGFQARALKHDAQVRWAGPRNPEGTAWTRVGFFPGTSGWEEVIVTEGPGDALTAVATGYDALAIRGAGLVSNAATLDQVAGMLQGRVAVIAGDGDPAGQQFSSKLAEELLARGVTTKVLGMREGKDLTDWRAEDPAWFQQGFVKEVAKLGVTTASATRAARWRYPFGDVGGAWYLRDKLQAEGRAVRYTEAYGFLQLDAGVWTRRSDTALRDEVHALTYDLRDVANAADDEGKAEVAKAARRYRDRVQSSNGVDAVLKELRSARGVFSHSRDFDRHPHLLAVRNGVLDLRAGELMPHDPALLLTKRVDLDYHPDAKAPRWRQFLAELFPGQPDMPPYMQRLIGYGVTGYTSEQMFAVFYGTGSNGKSVLTETLASVFSAISYNTPFTTFEQKQSGGTSDIAALDGARLVMAPEGDQNKRMAEALLKRLTGQDEVTARFLYRDNFTFRPQFLLLLSTNYRPAFMGQDEGLWRRVKLVEFRRHFAPAERDKDLGAKLAAESEGILAWAVEGARDWFARGDLGEPAAMTRAIADYRGQSDVLAGFLPGEWVAGAPSDRVPQTELFRSFQDWADAGNFKDLQSWSNRAFYRAIEERGHARHRAGGENFFIGLVKGDGHDPVPSEPLIAVGSVSPDTTPTDNRGPEF